MEKDRGNQMDKTGKTQLREDKEKEKRGEGYTEFESQKETHELKDLKELKELKHLGTLTNEQRNGFLEQGVDIPPEKIDRNNCLLKEFVIPFPFTLKDYFRGAKQYTYARKCFEETKGKDGIEVVVEKSYIDPRTGLPGIFSEKIYHLDGYFPFWLKKVIPSSALFLIEKSWDVYPYCITQVTSPFFSRLVFTIESYHSENDRGHIENYFQVSESEKHRYSKERLDIVTSKYHNSKYYHTNEDVSLMQEDSNNNNSKRPFLPNSNWSYTFSPVLCVYKLVTIKFEYFGIQKLTEDYIMNMERDLILRFHRQVYAWSDIWLSLSNDELNKIMNKFFEETQTKVKEFLRQHRSK
jgi:hypothetical protein